VAIRAHHLEDLGTPFDVIRRHQASSVAISGNHLEDLGTPFDVRFVDHHLPVEAAGSQERRVEHVDAVGAREHDDT
jgi:hypothetical protein